MPRHDERPAVLDMRLVIIMREHAARGEKVELGREFGRDRFDARGVPIGLADAGVEAEMLRGEIGDARAGAREFLVVNVGLGHRGAVDRPEQDKLRYAKLRSEEHTSELQSLMRISYAVFCLKKKK